MSGEPFAHARHVVFEGYDRRAVADLRKAGAFVAVDPLLQGRYAPRLRIVEDTALQRADRIAKVTISVS